MESVTVRGPVENGELQLTTAQLELERRFLRSMKAGSRVIRTTEKEVVDKTYKQVKTVFGLIVRVILNDFDDRGIDSSLIFRTKDDRPTGNKIKVDSLKNYLYEICPIYRNGKQVTLSKMTIEEASRFIDEVRNYATSWGVYIPEPDPNWKEKK